MHDTVDDMTAQRVLLFCKALTGTARVFILPQAYDWNDDIYEKALKKIGVEIIYPKAYSSKHLVKIVMKNEIKTVLFSSYNAVQEIERLLPLFENVVLDVQTMPDNMISKSDPKAYEAESVGILQRKEYCSKAKVEFSDAVKKADNLIVTSVKSQRMLKNKYKKKEIFLIPLTYRHQDVHKSSSDTVEEKIKRMFRNIMDKDASR